MTFTRIRLREGTTAAWEAANPILGAGEAGVDVERHTARLGDGVTPYLDLPDLVTQDVLDEALADVVAGSGSYVHTQTTPEAVWTVNHNLGFRPGGVTVIDSAGSTILVTPHHVNENTLTLTFVGGFSGVAYLS